jgi:hypothetical protein
MEGPPEGHLDRWEGVVISRVEGRLNAQSRVARVFRVL